MDNLELSIHIAAKPATVYRFLSDPKLFQQWMGTGATLSGGGIRVEYPGRGAAAVGTIREAVPDQRLVFGWGYEDSEHGLAPDSTTVTIELTATTDGGTQVTLTHQGLTDSKQRENHSMGWNYYLSQLSRHAAAIGLAERLPEIVATYCNAWNETSSERRRGLLSSCWELDAAFRDGMGSTDGLDALDQYIANAQKFMAGFKLEPSGPADLVHGYVRFSWVIRTPDGAAMMSGQNFGQLSASGKFQFLAGFSGLPKS